MMNYYLERYSFNNKLMSRSYGCGCCSDSDEIPKETEREEIEAYIKDLEEEIATWKAELA
jgi:hypothetical protein